ncbi:hypothetical protein [Rhizobium leguminosarum]|nr:hypothetical protein [Rhizobium leguminosarum]
MRTISMIAYFACLILTAAAFLLGDAASAAVFIGLAIINKMDAAA